MKKSIGKGHTLFDDNVCKSSTALWVLVAESCYEISKSLLQENAYAEKIQAGFSTFDGPLGQVSLITTDFPRYPAHLYAHLSQVPEFVELVELHWTETRRVILRVDCAPYVMPLFGEGGAWELEYAMLENIRAKWQQADLIGLGLEGCRRWRPRTYTPSRSEEQLRAQKILALKKHVYRLWEKCKMAENAPF
jgi:hypothetical protein